MESVRQAANQGLSQSNRLHARFWRNTHENLAAAEDALAHVDALARSGGDAGAQHAVALGRVTASMLPPDQPRSRLAVLRETLSIVSAGAAAGVGGAAGMAVRLLGSVTDAGPALLDEVAREATVEHSPQAPAIDGLRKLAEAGATPSWALQRAARHIPENAREMAMLTFELAPNEQFIPTALDCLPQLPTDAASASQLDRRHELMSMSLPAPVQLAADMTILHAIADGTAATAANAAALAWGLQQKTDATVAPLARWALNEAERAHVGTEWLALRNRLEARLPAPARDLFQRRTLQAVAEQQPYSIAACCELGAALVEAGGAAATAPVLADVRAQTAKDRNMSAAVDLLSGLSDAADVRAGLQWMAHPTTDAGDAVAQLGRALLARHNSDAVAQRVLASVRARAQADGQQHLVAQADFVGAAAGASTGMLAAGIARLAEGPAADETGLAQLASAMSHATDNFSDKARLARTAMWQIETRAAASGNLALQHVTATMRDLADVEDARMHNSPNRVWFRAASSQRMLDLLSRGVRADGKGLLDAYQSLMDAQWASVDYQLALGKKLLGPLDMLSKDPLLAPLVEQTRQAVQAAATPQQQAAALRKGLADITRLSHDPFSRALRNAIRGGAGEDAPVIERETEYVIIDGVKVPKVGKQLPTAEPTAAPLAAEVPPPVVRPLDLSVEDTPVPAGIETASRVEWRDRYERGVGGVFNPASGQVEWKDRYERGVGGAYNPNTGQVEWKDRYERGVAAVYNPRKAEIEWKDAYERGVGGVFNPLSGEVEWKTAYERGVAGVFNPERGEIEWNTRYERGVAGIWNPKTRSVEWRDRYERGVGVICTDPMYPTLNCGSMSKDWD